MAILQLSQSALIARVKQEIIENPALEALDDNPMGLQQADAMSARTQVPTVTPDVRVERTQNGFYEAVMDVHRTPYLTIRGDYLQRLSRPSVTIAERKQVRRKVESAKWLIESIRQRRDTLTRVAQAIVEGQREFFEQDSGSIKPLQFREIAALVDRHVATVSRAVDNKWIETHRGVFPLKRFVADDVAE